MFTLVNAKKVVVSMVLIFVLGLAPSFAKTSRSSSNKSKGQRTNTKAVSKAPAKSSRSSRASTGKSISSRSRASVSRTVSTPKNKTVTRSRQSSRVTRPTNNATFSRKMTRTQPKSSKIVKSRSSLATRIVNRLNYNRNNASGKSSGSVQLSFNTRRSPSRSSSVKRTVEVVRPSKGKVKTVIGGTQRKTVITPTRTIQYRPSASSRKSKSSSKAATRTAEVRRQPVKKKSDSGRASKIAQSRDNVKSGRITKTTTETRTKRSGEANKSRLGSRARIAKRISKDKLRVSRTSDEGDSSERRKARLSSPRTAKAISSSPRIRKGETDRSGLVSESHRGRVRDGGRKAVRHNRRNRRRFGHYPGRIFNRIVWPRSRYIIRYRWGPHFTFRYVYPYHHRRYVFVSLGGYWPLGYRHLRYYWYGYHPYYWYGYYPWAYRVGGDTYNYYTYNYSNQTVPQTSAPVTNVIRPVDENTFADVREKLARQAAEEPAEETETDQLFEDAVKAFEGGDYKLAAGNFAEAIEMAPDDIVLPFAYVQALFAQEQYSKAAEALRETLGELSGDEMDVFFPRGLYAEDDTLFEQIELLAETAEAYSFDSDLQLLLGYQLLGVGEFDEAIEPLEQASLDSYNAEAAIILLELLEKVKNENSEDNGL